MNSPLPDNSCILASLTRAIVPLCIVLHTRLNILPYTSCCFFNHRFLYFVFFATFFHKLDIFTSSFETVDLWNLSDFSVFFNLRVDVPRLRSCNSTPFSFIVSLRRKFANCSLWFTGGLSAGNFINHRRTVGRSRVAEFEHWVECYLMQWG